MARPLPLISSSSSSSFSSISSFTSPSSLSAVHRALSSHLHRLLSPCQLVGSASSLTTRRKALKELTRLIRQDTHSHAALAAADVPTARWHIDRSSSSSSEWGDGDNDEKEEDAWADGSDDAAESDISGGRFGVSWCVVIRSVLSIARADHNSKRPTDEVWKELLYCVDTAERQQHVLATKGSPSLLAELVSLIRMLLSNGTDAATLSVCAQAVTRLTLLLLSHPPYLSHISSASLIFLFRFFSLTYQAILSSKDEATFTAAVRALTADNSFFNSASIVPPPATLLRFGQPVAQLLAALIQHFPAGQLPAFFLDHVFPFLTTLVASRHPAVADVPIGAKCFSSASFATLLSAFSSSLQRHYAILHSHVAQCLPVLISSLLACWPLNSHSGSALQVKQAASSLLSWSFALQLHSPHRTLQCFAPFDSSHPLAAICLHELRQPHLFTQHGLEVLDESDVITSRVALPLSMDEPTYRFVRMCVQLFHALELQHISKQQQHRQQEQREDESKTEKKEDAVLAGQGGDDMRDDAKDGSHSIPPTAHDPTDGVDDEHRTRKRRKAVHVLLDDAFATPLQQCLSALCESSTPSTSLLYFLFLLSSCPSSSSLLFSSPTHTALLLDVLHFLCRCMRRGKDADVRLWSVACATTLAAAQHRYSHTISSADSTQALQAGWSDIASVCLSHLLHDDRRLVKQHALSLLASLLFHQLVPGAQLASVHALLAELPRLTAAAPATVWDLSASGSDGTASSGRGGVKAERKQQQQQQQEVELADSQSAPSAFLYSTPQVECSSAAMKLIAASLLTRDSPAAVDRSTAAEVHIGGANSVDELLTNWLLVLLSRPTSKLTIASDWHRLTLHLLVHRFDPQSDDSSALTSLASYPLSWAEIDMPACSLDDARAPAHYLPSHRLTPSLYPPPSPFTVSLDEVNYDSVSEMEGFMQTAQFARLLPLPSHINKEQPHPSVSADSAVHSKHAAASDASSALLDQLPRLRLHIHALLSATGAVETGDSEEDVDERWRYLRLHLHFLRLVAPLVHHSDREQAATLQSELVAPLVGSFATLLLSFQPSAATLAACHQLLSGLDDIVHSYSALSADCSSDLTRSYTALSSSLAVQLLALIQRADEAAAAPQSINGTRSSSPTADTSKSSAVAPAVDDFDGDDDGSADDYHANSTGAATASLIATLLAPRLRSLSGYRPCLLAMYRLLLDLLASGIPLQHDQRHSILALAQQSSTPFVFPLLFLASLHDSFIDGNNVQLLLATRTVCETATAHIQRQRQNTAARRRSRQQQQQQSSKQGRRKRRKVEKDADEENGEEDDEDADEVMDSADDAAMAGAEDADLPAVAVEAISFFLHLCQFVTSGHIELAHEPESGVEQSEEDMLSAYCGTLISAAFPSSSSSSSNPLSVSPLLRCLCSRFGLASGLLSSWSLPSSLFPLLSLAPSAAVRAVVSYTVSSLLDFSADKERLWQSSSQQLADLMSDVRGVQAAADEKRDAVASAGCDDRLYALLGCMCSLACHSLYSERRALLKLLQLYSSAAEGSRWVARWLLQQMSEALSYTSLSVVPPSILPPLKLELSTSGAPSLFVERGTSLVEEHLLYLLTEWMSDPVAELSAFPFELLRLTSSTEAPFAAPSSPSSFLHYDPPVLSSSLRSFMPHVLRACLLYLPARQPTLLALPSLVNERHLPSLLALHWPALFSLLYSLYAHDAVEMRQAADRLVTFLKKDLTDRTFQSLYKSHPAAPIVCQLMSLVVLSPSHAALPSYGVDELSKSLIQLAQQKAANATSTSVSDLLCRPGDEQLLSILMHVRASLYSEYRAERQWLWLRSLETVIERLGVSVARGYVCAALLDCLVPLLDDSDERFPPHAGYVAGLITALMQRVVSVAWQGGADEGGEKGTSGHTDMTAQQISQHVRFVILVLLNYASTEQRCEKVRNGVQSLIASAPAIHPSILPLLALLTTHPCMASLSLQSSPALPSLAAVLSTFLSCFDSLSDHTNTVCMLPLLRCLHTELSSRQSEVVAILRSDPSVTSPASSTSPSQQRSSKQAVDKRAVSAQPQATPSPPSSSRSSPLQLVQCVIASLLLLCRSSGASVELSDCAAQCLGCVGVLDPQQLVDSYFTLFATNCSTQAQLSATTDASSRPAGSALPSCFTAAFTRWQQLGGGVDFHTVSISPVALVSWFHLHRHYHHYLLYLLILGLRSASLVRQQLSYQSLLCIFAAPSMAAEAQSAFRALSPNGQLLLGPFYLRSQQLQSRTGKRGSDAALDTSPLSAVLSTMATLPADKAHAEQALRTATAVVAHHTAFSPTLWSTRDTNRQRWLSTLVFHLLRSECGDRLLAAMSDCALLDPHSAERLLPLAVMDVLSSDRVDSHEQLAHAITVSMRETLDRHASDASTLLRFLSPLLSSMQYVREQLLVLLRQPVPAPAKAAAPSALPDGDTAASADPPSAPAPAPKAELCARLRRFLRFVDPLLLAEAANALQWNSTALLWLERWNDSRQTDQQPQQEQPRQQSERWRKRKQGVDGLDGGRRQDSSSRDEHDAARFHSLLLSAYRRMDEPDALAGLLHCTPTTLTASLTADCIQAETQHDWATALAIYDIQQTPQALLSALRNMQCSHLLSAYAGTLPAAEVMEKRMEMAWRNTDFSLPEPHLFEKGFHASLYSVLRSMSRGQPADTALLSAARRGLQPQLDVLHPERVSDVFPLMAQLALLAAVDNPHLLAQRCQSDSSVSALEFDLLEPLLALQTSMLLFPSQSARQLVSHLCHSSSLARQADRPLLAAHNIRVAAQQLARISDGGERQVDECRLQLFHAQLTARQGGMHGAVHEMRGVLQSLQRVTQQQQDGTADRSSTGQQSQLLPLLQQSNSLLGEWLSKSHSESSDKVGEYLKAALQYGQEVDRLLPAASASSAPFSVSSASLSSSSSPTSVPPSASMSSVGELHFALGSFYDRQFQSLLAKQQTTEYQQRRVQFRRQADAIAEDKKRLTTPEAVALLSKKGEATKGDAKWAEVKKLERLINTREKEHEMDGREFKLHDAAYISHLEAAIVHYQHCLASTSQQHDTFALYRFCALWFNHDRYTPMSEQKKISNRKLATLPTYRFIPLIYQIASRLLPYASSRAALSSSPGGSAISEVEREWRRSVTALLLKLCLDHPHHCLAPIFALSSGSQIERVQGSFHAAFESNKERIDAARALIKLLRSAKRGEDGRSILPVIEAQEKLYGAYVELGNRRYKREDRQVQLKDTQLDKLTRAELSRVAVPTLSLPVQPNCDYSHHLISPLRFEPTFHFANSGINKPLILEMLCSDGSRHKQLLKPSDDLRQDAVMEQLFALVNVLLNRPSDVSHSGSSNTTAGSGGGNSGSSSGRRLKMRTYNVVPLTPGVGLVEWVNNTKSLHDCLVNHTDGAHTRYQSHSPDAWSYTVCMTHLRECTDNAERLTRYREVCSHFRPVFHHYFMEHFASPSSWLHHRTSYVYSMAVSSMVGYVVGLGDRHIQNILLDSRTSELIHIDLGVAFDTGQAAQNARARAVPTDPRPRGRLRRGRAGWAVPSRM